MSMGYSACFTEHVSDDNLKKILGDEADKLDQLKKLWTAIKKRVKKETGLKLYINYHDSANSGSCYDDVDGVFFDFAHGELYKPSAKFQKLRKKFGDNVVERQFFVEFG